MPTMQKYEELRNAFRFSKTSSFSPLAPSDPHSKRVKVDKDHVAVMKFQKHLRFYFNFFCCLNDDNYEVDLKILF